MSKLLHSLLNPAPVVVTEALPAPTATPTTSVSVDEITLKGKLKESGTGQASVGVEAALTYTGPGVDYDGEDGLYLAVDFVIEGEISVDDQSFDYEQGSQRGTHQQSAILFENVGVTHVVFPHDQSNFPLVRQSPEVVKHVTAFVTQWLNENIESIVDLEKLANEADIVR